MIAAPTDGPRLFAGEGELRRIESRDQAAHFTGQCAVVGYPYELEAHVSADDAGRVLRLRFYYRGRPDPMAPVAEGALL
jgi:hypothetical protein